MGDLIGLNTVRHVKKPIRTASGVTPLTVVAMPYNCPHGRCTYCPGGGTVPMSYTEKSPAIMRAISVKYDPVKQVNARLNMFKGMGHPTSKIELIYLGGTFLAYPQEYQDTFVKRCFDGLNGSTSETLEAAQLKNETADHRCVAFCIETKPDWAFEQHINQALRFGATRIEIGVQLPDDTIYKATNRGHTVQDVIKSTAMLKDAGYKVGYHVMPGLPGSDPEKDLKLFKMLFEHPDYRPDQLKIYPCQVMEKTPLALQWKRGEYKPYDEKTIIELVANMKLAVPEWCRIMRTMRQFHNDSIIAGSYKSDLRNAARTLMDKRGQHCQCIRCREIGHQEKAFAGTISIETSEYKASGGTEFFIQAVNEKNIIFGLCRARIPGNPWRPEITADSLLIRELHVYGKEVPIDQNGSAAQHRGLGRKLMQKAEDIAKERGCKKIVVISGIGVREYYRKLGYEREGPYMVKAI